MSDFIPKSGSGANGAGSPGIKIGGLGRKAQKLQALKEKAAQQKAGGKAQFDGASSSQVKAKTSFAGGKKPSFNRKAV